MKQYNVPYRTATVASKSCDVCESSSCSKDYKLSASMPKLTGMADFEMFKAMAITKESKNYSLNKEGIIKSVSGHNCFSKEIYVSTKLDIFPCVMERRQIYGNLKEKALKSLIKENDKTIHLTKDDIDGCKGCEYRYHCFDCRPDSNGNKDFYSKPWNCSYNPKIDDWMDLRKMYQHLKGAKI